MVRNGWAVAHLIITGVFGLCHRSVAQDWNFHESSWLDEALDPSDRADALLKAMTLDEKLSMVRGIGQHWGVDGYAGATTPVQRLGIPALKLEDGPQGVADGVHGVTAWPSALTVVASWERDLVKRYASAIAVEQRIKGTNVMLGPMVNIARVPRGGRNFESFGEDPHLSADMAKAYVKGVQSRGVIACVKHFADNNQELDRMTVSASVSERAQWELYYPAFKAAVDAGVGSVMCSYNRINETYACQNPKTLEHLKVRMGFSGWVVSDWGATHSTVESALAGLDQEMPGSYYFGDSLRRAVAEDRVPQSRVDDMVGRMLWAMFSIGLFDSKTKGDLTQHATSARHDQLARQMATAGTVLLKNSDKLLPLPTSVRSIAVIGDDAQAEPRVVGGGSGGVAPPYLITPLNAITYKADEIGASVTYTRTNYSGLAAKEASRSDVAIVFVSAYATEGQDRESLSLGRQQDSLIRSVVSMQPKTVVVVHAPGAVLMPWADEVAAILMAFVPGQADGAAIVDILFGSVVPGGKLPISFPREESDTWLQTSTQYPGVGGITEYSEGLLVGYRWYDAKGIAPLFPFGHGLSYTTFEYRKLKVRPEPSSSFTVTAEILNTGDRTGAEVVQLYLGFPPRAGEPPKQLKGFQKVEIAARARRGVSFVLTGRDFSVYDTHTGAWTVVTGAYSVMLGSSSRDIRLNQTILVLPDQLSSATYR